MKAFTSGGLGQIRDSEGTSVAAGIILRALLGHSVSYLSHLLSMLGQGDDMGSQPCCDGCLLHSYLGLGHGQVLFVTSLGCESPYEEPELRKSS